MTAARSRLGGPLLQSLAAGALVQAVLIPSGIIVARSLGPHNRGVLALLTLLPLLVTQIVALGIPLAATYAIAAGRVSPGALLRRLRRPIALQLLAGGAVQGALIAVLLLPRTPSGFLSVALASLALGVAGLAQTYGLALLQGEKRFTAFNALRVGPACLYVTLVVALVAAHEARLTTIAAVWILANVSVSALTVAVAVRKSPERRELSQQAPPILSLASFGIRGMFGATSPVSSYRLDQLVVGATLTPEALGLYVVALAFTNLTRFLGQSIGMVAYPSIASDPDPSAVRRGTRGYFGIGAVVCSTVTVVVAVAVPWLVPAFFGRAFASAVGPARLLLVAGLFASLRRILADATRGASRPTWGTVAELSTLLALPLAVLATEFGGGLEGVAGALIAGDGIGFLVLLPSLSRPDFMLGASRNLLQAFLTTLHASPVRRRHTRPQSMVDSLLPSMAGASLVALCAATGVLLALSPKNIQLSVVFLATLSLAIALWVKHSSATYGLKDFRSSLHHVGWILLGLAFLVISWNAVKVPVLPGTYVSAFYVALLPAAGLLTLAGVTSLPTLGVSRWLFMAAGGFVVAELLASMFPPSSTYLASRYSIITPITQVVAEMNPNSPTANLLKLELGICVLPVLTAIAAQSRTAVTRLLDIWAVSGVASALVAVLDFFGITRISSSLLRVSWGSRETGLTNQPNHLAVMSAVALPVVLSWLLRGPRWRLAGGASAAVLAGGIYLSGSRGGAVAGIFAMGVTVVGLRPLRRYAARLAAGGIVVLLLVFSHLPSLLNPIGAQTRLSGSALATLSSNQEHTQLRHQAIKDFAQAPIQGIGLQVAQAAHDIYLQVLASGGAIGLAAFLFFLGAVASATRRTLSENREVVVCAAAAIMTWLGVGLVENQLLTSYVYVPAAALLALSATRTRHSPQAEWTVQDRGRAVFRGRPTKREAAA